MVNFSGQPREVACSFIFRCLIQCLIISRFEINTTKINNKNTKQITSAQKLNYVHQAQVLEYIKHERHCGTSKDQEERSKYDTQRCIFDEFRGVWIADGTLSQVFDIHVSSQSKQKLRSKCMER